MSKKISVAASEAEAATKKKLEIPTETFKSDGVEYRFKRAQFIVPGHGKMTAAEALENDEALAVLVVNESSVIEVVAKKAGKGKAAGAAEGGE